MVYKQKLYFCQAVGCEMLLQLLTQNLHHKELEDCMLDQLRKLILLKSRAKKYLCQIEIGLDVDIVFISSSEFIFLCNIFNTSPNWIDIGTYISMEQTFRIW